MRTDSPLPEQTRDDTDAGWGEPADREGTGDDQRFLDERPPHHDR